MDYELVNDRDWENQISFLVEENKEWLDKVRRIKLGFDENQQIEMLCQEVIKWHELAKETYTLLESLYENFIPIFSNVDKDSLEFHTSIFFSYLEERFKRVKNNYNNNIDAKLDPNYKQNTSM
jgi:hypothetical protein